LNKQPYILILIIFHLYVDNHEVVVTAETSDGDAEAEEDLETEQEQRRYALLVSEEGLH